MIGVQDIVVTLVALGAAVVLVQRVLAFVLPSPKAPACSSCSPACATGEKTAEAAPAATHVLHVVRPKSRA
jgi:hypothetical protein